MTRNRAMQQLSLANLVFLAGTASGALLTLSSFESLASPAPLSCVYAYNAPIRGCTADDFAKGATCSETCVEGLQAAQFTVRSLCAKASTANNPVLQQIQNGNLVAAVCKTSTPASTPISSPATTLQTSTIQTSTIQTSTIQTSTIQTSTIQTSTIQTSTIQTPPPSQASPTPQSTSDVASQVTSTQQPVSTEVASSTAASATPDQSITSAVSSSAIESATPTSQTSVEKPSSSSEEPSKPTKPINPNAQPGSGGGSPFDFVAISTATRFNHAETFTTLATAAVMAALILI